MATKSLGRVSCLVRPLKNAPIRPKTEVKLVRSLNLALGHHTRKINTKNVCLHQTMLKRSTLFPSQAKTINGLYCSGRRHFTQFMAVANAGSTDALSTENGGGGTFYFDTHKLVKTLQGRGFSLEQAEAITSSLTQVIGTGATALSKYMVSRNELAQLEIRMNATIEALRKDMVILEKSEFLMLKQENENLKAEVNLTTRVLKDELLKLRSGLALDMSLEKGRVKEEMSSQEQKVKDANNRIDTEIARVKMGMEAQKLDLIKYIVGSFLSVVTVFLGWWRFMKA